MLQGLVQFGLTRRPIILLCLLVFIGGGLICFEAKHRGLPNPWAAR